jgi:hypothetical protein
MCHPLELWRFGGMHGGTRLPTMDNMLMCVLFLLYHDPKLTPRLSSLDRA